MFGSMLKAFYYVFATKGGNLTSRVECTCMWAYQYTSGIVLLVPPVVLFTVAKSETQMNGRERTSSSSSALSLSPSSSFGEFSPENEVEREEEEGGGGGGGVFDDGGETQALLIASVESRLQHIPDSCEKYKPTLSAIEALQVRNSMPCTCMYIMWYHHWMSRRDVYM